MSSFFTRRQTRTSSFLLCAAVLCASSVSRGECQVTPAATPVPCSAHKDCGTCVPHAECLWCFSSNNCTDYPVSWLLPPASLCRLSQARWGVCWMNFEALIIILAVLGGTVLISIIVCCCCCCCSSCSRCRSRPSRDEERLTRKREEMKQHAEERKVERKERQDEIRRKYGLMVDKDHPYSKFENE